ncbi:MAG: MerR family transcriptional regulator [Nitrospirae bacterium]|nr:MAG: MerR family transcriptional regulator [Nitrospirota bacterium]
MNKREQDKTRPLYMISVVCEMLDVHPQTLRLYEKEGLVHPLRTNKQRLYSENDVERLTFILQLTREMGVNRAGVDIILRMRHRMEALHREMEDMVQLLEDDTRRSFRERIRRALRED